MWEASRDGKLAEVKRLVAAGADINAKTKLSDRTPLEIAIFKKHTSVVEYLISLPNIQVSGKGETAIHMVCQNHSEIDIVKLLVEKGIDINAFNNFGCTGLHVAIEHRKLAMAQYLISLPKCDLEVRDKQGYKALHKACKDDSNIDVVKQVAGKGIDINAADQDGLTGLHWAIRDRYSPVAEYLISLPEFDIHIKNYDGKTALDVAKEKGNHRIVHLLEKRVSDEKSSKPVNVDTGKPGTIKQEQQGTSAHQGKPGTRKQEQQGTSAHQGKPGTRKQEQQGTSAHQGKPGTSKQEQQGTIAHQGKPGTPKPGEQRTSAYQELLQENKQLQAFTQCLQEELDQLVTNNKVNNQDLKEKEFAVKKDLTKAPVKTETCDVQVVAQGASAAEGSTKPGLSDRKLLQVAKEVGSEWKTLGGFLDVLHSDIQRIYQTYPGETLYCGWCMLIDWRDAHQGDSTSQEEDLKNALQEQGKVNLLELL